MKNGFLTYENLEVWMEARKLVSQIYGVSKEFPKEELYGLTNQIRRAAVSVPSNIAEGCGRNTTKDKLHFFYISRGSLFESETQMFVALDLNYISEDDKVNLKAQIELCKKLLNGFINYNKSKLQTKA